MKHNTSFQTIAKGFFVIAVLIASVASAFASDYFLKIEGVKGERARIVRCPDGACTVDGLAPGEYSVSLVDAQGKVWLPANFRLTTTLSVATTERDAATGQASGKSIQSPRDVASGLPTGKRMHKPITVTAELSKTTSSTHVTAPSVSNGETVMKWTLEIRVQKIEMK